MKKIKVLSFLTLPLVLVGTGAVVVSSLYDSNGEEAKIERKIRDIEGSIKNGLKIKDISTDGDSTLAIITDSLGNDSLYSWGSNSNGKLGIGISDGSYVSPQRVNIPQKYELKHVEVSYDDAAVVASNDGIDHLYIWGDNTQGQLGNGTKNDSYLPIEVSLPVSSKIVDFDLGWQHSSVAIEDSVGITSLYSWGRNSEGQVGINSTSKNILNPTLVSTFISTNTIKSIESGAYHSGAVVTDYMGIDHLYMWGYNYYGQLGINSTSNHASRPMVLDEELNVSEEIVDLSLGGNFSGIITSDSLGIDHLYMWGRNLEGQVGIGTTTSKYSRPMEIIGTSNRDLTNLEIGTDHASLVSLDSLGNSNLSVWGHNTSGELGLGYTSNKVLSPALVTLPMVGEIIDLSLGSSSTVMVIEDESSNQHLYGWGSNDLGQLGLTNLGDDVVSPIENDLFNNNNLITSTMFVELVKNDEFIFDVSTPSDGWDTDNVRIYNSNGVKVGDTSLLDKTLKDEATFRFGSVITDTDSATNENLYWSVDGGETLNLISETKYVYVNDPSNVVLYSSLEIGFVILMILIIIFVVLLLSRDNEKEDNSNDYMGSNEKNSRKEKKSKKQREQEQANQRNNVLDAF